MKITILLGHPDKESKGGSFVDAYEKGAMANGHEIRRINLGELKFDPILHHGYKTIQELEPDLHKAQEDINWCEHFVILYPSWWSTMPALLKGFFDRVWLPGFSFHFKAHGIGAGYFWKRMLAGKSATVFVTSDSHPWPARFLFGDTTNEIKKCILWFAGFHPIKVKKVGGLKHVTEQGLTSWREKFEGWGRGGTKYD